MSSSAVANLAIKILLNDSAFHFSLKNPSKLVYFDIQQIEKMDKELRSILEMCSYNSGCQQKKEISKEIYDADESERHSQHIMLDRSYYASEATLLSAIGFISKKSVVPYFQKCQSIRTRVYSQFLFSLGLSDTLLPIVCFEIGSFMGCEESVESLYCGCGLPFEFIGRNLLNQQLEFKCVNEKITQHCFNVYLWDHCSKCGDLFISIDNNTNSCFSCNDQVCLGCAGDEYIQCWLCGIEYPIPYCFNLDCDCFEKHNLCGGCRDGKVAGWFKDIQKSDKIPIDVIYSLYLRVSKEMIQRNGSCIHCEISFDTQEFEEIGSILKLICEMANIN